MLHEAGAVKEAVMTTSRVKLCKAGFCAPAVLLNCVIIKHNKPINFFSIRSIKL